MKSRDMVVTIGIICYNEKKVTIEIKKNNTSRKRYFTETVGTVYEGNKQKKREVQGTF